MRIVAFGSQHFKNLIGSLLVLMFLVAPSRTQSTFGSITGTVTDKSSAAVPGASIVVTSEGTGVIRRATAGSDGVYTVNDLLPGAYRIEVEAKGFSPLDRRGISLDANRVVNVDVQMTVGSASTRVEVVASAPIINTETPTTSYLKTVDHLMEMPALVRQTNSNEGFAIYNPGVGVNQSGNFYANGVRQIDNYLSNDGIVEMSDPDTIGGGPIAPDLDSIAEISYILSNAPAEFKSPVDFTTVTKSGTNQLHGSAYYDYNGAALNARNFFSSTVPARVYNDYAVHAGGPIRKNKTFFFAAFEDSSNHLASLINASAPLVPWRTGDFSGLLPKTVLKDPSTGQPFPNNQIPQSRINATSLKAQSFFFPLPNFGSPATQSGNYRAQDPVTQVFKVVDGRIDHNFSEHDVVFGRGTYRRYPIVNWGNFLPPVGEYNQLRTDSTAVFSWTHTFSPSLLNEFRTGYARNRSILSPTLVGSDILNQIGLQGVPTTGIHDVPVFSITGIQSTSQSNYQINLGTNFQWTDNVSWTHGAHSFKFGFDAIYDQIGGFSLPNTVYGTFTFTGVYTGQAYADFLLGIPQSTGQTAPTPERYARGTMWNMYAQDQWKITSRLTASYGLRYELQGPYYDNLGRIFAFDPKNSALVVPDNGISEVSPLFPKNIKIETATQAGYPNPALVRFPKDNFYPRIGLAYKLTADGKTSIRSGYGIFGNTIYGGLAYNSVGGPFAGSETFFNSISPNGTPLLTFPNPFVSNAGTVTALQNVAGFNPNIRTPYTQQWNVTLERQFHSVGLSLAYIGAQSIALLYGRNLNQPPASTTKFSGYLNPAFNTITWKENGGTESYNSLQASAVKNLGQGLTFSTGWTWARDLTDVPDNDNIVTGFATPNSYNLRADRGNNTFTPIQRYYGDVVYALPIGAHQPFLNTLPHWADAALGGWRVSSVVTLQTGLFYSPYFTAGFDPSNTNTLGGRPDRIAGVSLTPPGGPTANGWFNAAAFKIPGCPDANPVCPNPVSPGRFGNAGLDILQGPSMKNADIALMKDFAIHERFKVQFQAVFANAFNHPSFARPCSLVMNGECYADISSPATVGHITATDASYLKGSQASRNINFALRIRF
jgi:hypothetical protein